MSSAKVELTVTVTGGRETEEEFLRIRDAIPVLEDPAEADGEDQR
jgi:hypothetical protein